MLNDRNSRLDRFRNGRAAAGDRVSLQRIWESAKVDRRDFRRWRSGELPEGSLKSKRVEAVLSGSITLRPPKKSGKQAVAPHCIAPQNAGYPRTVEQHEIEPRPKHDSPARFRFTGGGMRTKSLTAQVFENSKPRQKGLTELVMEEYFASRDRLSTDVSRRLLVEHAIEKAGELPNVLLEQ